MVDVSTSPSHRVLGLYQSGRPGPGESGTPKNDSGVLLLSPAYSWT